MRIGTNELLIILVVALLIFGPKNLPKLGNNFKKGMEEGEEEENTSKAETQTEKKDDEE